MLLRLFFGLQAVGEVLHEGPEGFGVAQEDQFVASQGLDHLLAVGALAVRPAPLLRLAGVLHELRDLRDLGEADEKLAREVRQHLVGLVQRDDRNQMRLEELPIGESQPDEGLEAAVVGEVAVDVLETLLAVVVLHEHIVPIQLFLLADALHSEKKVRPESSLELLLLLPLLLDVTFLLYIVLKVVICSNVGEVVDGWLVLGGRVL